MTNERSIESLAKKIRLERKLNIEMRRILNRYARVMERSLRLRRSVPDARLVTGNKTFTVIHDQYERTSNAFKKDFRQEIAKSYTPIFEHKQLNDNVDEALSMFISTESVTRSSIIVTTTQRDSEAALVRATMELLDEEIALTNEAVASRTSEIFRRGINGRSSTIAATETQNAAEGTKKVEVDTTVRDPSTPVERVNKTWDTIEDGNERETHREADGQTVDSLDVFKVGGSVLQYPGDDSHGAELKETINCRCNSIYEPVGL